MPEGEPRGPKCGVQRVLVSFIKMLVSSFAPDLCQPGSHQVTEATWRGTQGKFATEVWPEEQTWGDPPGLSWGPPAPG